MPGVGPGNQVIKGMQPGDTLKKISRSDLFLFKFYNLQQKGIKAGYPGGVN